MKRYSVKTLFKRSAVILLLAVMLVGILVPWNRVEAAGNKLALSNSDPTANQTFQISNMVPGQEYTQTYRVNASCSGDMHVGIRAYVTQGSQKLAEALQMTVKRVDTDKFVYKGFVKDMDWAKTAISKSQELVYEVTFFLDSSLGNDYQNLSLNLNLEWKMESPMATFWLWFGIIGGIVAVAGLTVAFIFIRKSKKAKAAVRAASNLILALVLIVAWGTTTAVVAAYQMAVNENALTTGVLKVNLNDGKPVFEEDIKFEPGMIIQRKFTIANEGNVDVIYHLWFAEIEGDLAKELTVEIKDGKRRIFEGVLEDFMEEKIDSTNATLLAGETKELTIIFTIPEEAGNNVRGKEVTFRLNYEATQKDGNPNKEFE